MEQWEELFRCISVLQDSLEDGTMRANKVITTLASLHWPHYTGLRYCSS